MRSLLLSVAVLLFSSGCAASHSTRSSTGTTNTVNSLRALQKAAGTTVALTPGASDFAPGKIRYPFLVIDENGASIERPSAQVWVARGLNEQPFERRAARLQQVGVSGGAKRQGSHLYVAYLNIRSPGKYWVLAKPLGGKSISGVGNLFVRRRTFSPAIGSMAYPSRTPTLRSARGKLSLVTTRVPPDRALLRYSVGESLAAHKPFVVVFATPKFCTSRTCGPVVDVVSTVQRRFTKTDIRFIHVEIYRDNDPAKGFNRWVGQWHLPTEPWVFLVGRDGKIKAKFEGSVSVDELDAAVLKYLGDA